MRKLIVLLTMIVSSFGFISAASPAIASAAGANCTNVTVSYPVYTGGLWEWYGALSNCSQVSAVQFNSAGTATAYMVDQRDGSVHFPISGGGTINGIYTYYNGFYYNIPWGPGCGGGFHFNEYQTYQYRIKNALTGTWGTFHSGFGPWVAIC